ncbi:MAG: hypothetical protein JRJ42_00515 [Deltaproteobacteria bacterium]|nr:hypothetical protein [Deltaproteobacteria bacterium]MBW2018953.1 hypothetical protein [Deltaproteobacteria bacterium]MBW2073168.1 hypothetical protein [Deltaproteobacteria bacterium]RLB83788.1 MAG: hypothetical protein DRH17_01120 [Deltaproteobacteria bacterium]
MSNTEAETGTRNETSEIFEMESFDMPDAGSTAKTRSSTFEPSYSGHSEDDAFQFWTFSGDREKAEGIIDEAKKKASLIESEAYEKGFSQGEKDGFEMGTKKIDKVLDRIHGICNDMASYRHTFIETYEKEMLRLIRAIAEKVVRGAVAVDKQIVRETILEAFSLAAERMEVTISVNPEDVEYVKEIRPDFFDRIKELKSITIKSDPSISRGGCFMETAFGHVDARVETQLEKIARAVERAFEEGHVVTGNGES